jgi:hypothetical protein
MPLVTLKTNFKNLKFGKDRPGGGSSNQPYITKDIPSGDPSNIFNTGGVDSLLRGGLMAPLKAANDVSRLTQMFFDLKSPNGLLFTAKQNVLSRSSVETEATKGPAYGGKAVNQGIYLPTSTILQAGVGFTGTHLNLLGLDPSSPMTGVRSGGIFPSLGLNRYETAANENNEGKGSPNNRLVKLTKSTDLFLSEYSGGPGSVLGIGKTKIPFSLQRTGENNPQSTSNPKYFYSGSIPWGRSKDSWISPIIKGASFKYQEFGGSNLLEFNGNSVITSDGDYTFEPNIYNKTTKVDSLEPKSDAKTYQATRPTSRTTGSIVYEPENDITTKSITKGIYTSENTSQQPIIASGSFGLYATDSQGIDVSKGITLNKSKSNKIAEDFRKRNLGEISKKLKSPGYDTSKRIDLRVNYGDPGGGKRIDRVNYTTGRGILDKINASEIYTAENPNHSKDFNDLCKFSIGIVNNSDSSTSNYINFRAFIDSFSDSYSSDWGEINYLGRGDKFYNYKGFNRDISLSWTVPAQSKAELIPMYKKLNYLASSLAPSYSTGGFMQGNLARLTVGGYLYNQLGIIKSITYDVPPESPWEIGINTEGGYDNSVKELPMMIKVTGFKFTPIHEFVPSKSNFGVDTKTQDKRYIALATNSNNNYDN